MISSLAGYGIHETLSQKRRGVIELLRWGESQGSMAIDLLWLFLHVLCTLNFLRDLNDWHFRFSPRLKHIILSGCFCWEEGAHSYPESKRVASFTHSLVSMTVRTWSMLMRISPSYTQALPLSSVFFTSGIVRACGSPLSLHFSVCKDGLIGASVPEIGRGLEAMI